MGSDSEISTLNANSNVKSVGKKRFLCHYDDCFAAFNRQAKLDRHICTHTKERPFKCDYEGCKKNYTSKDHLRRHISVSHRKIKLPPVTINCPYPECFKQFQNKYSLKKHCKSHAPENQYKCPECSALFKKRWLLNSHVFEHTGLFPYKCSQCSESFVTQRQLKSHERKHKTYICEYIDCREEFQAWSLLRRHFKLKHKRNYKCDICGHMFINKNTMKKHILTHLNIENPEVYKCPYKDCIKYYKYKNNLNHHVQVAHEGKRFKCSEENCMQVFKSRLRLKDHEMRHKNGTLNIPRIVSSNTNRKPRKDKGLRRKSMAALLSGIILPQELDKTIAQSLVTPEIDKDINETIDILEKKLNEKDTDCIQY